MADDLSLGELTRRTDTLATTLTQLVQRTEYVADRRYDDRRFVEVEADIAELKRENAEFRRQLSADLKALQDSVSAATEKRGTNVRQMIYSGLLPALFLLAGIVVQIWIAARGAG